MNAINAKASGPQTRIQSTHKNDFPVVACDSFCSHSHARQECSCKAVQALVGVTFFG